MKPSKTPWILLILCLLSAMPCFAHDTDLYMSSGEGVEPNILIIFDNSGSMNDEVQAYFYDPGVTYDPLAVPPANANTVYYRTRWGSWAVFKTTIAGVPCAAARTALTNQGHYEGATSFTVQREHWALQQQANAKLFMKRWVEWIRFNRFAEPEVYAE